jgi:hypothetical protein
MPKGERIKTEDGRANIVGERLRERRRTLKLTHAEMIQGIANVSGGQWEPKLIDYKRLEAGRRTCIDVEAVCLAKLLNCAAGWLLGDAGALSPPEDVDRDLFDPKPEVRRKSASGPGD